jgi:sulfide:quinone oxidoreductase
MLRHRRDRLKGGASAAPYGAAATCYIELGGGDVGRVDVSFAPGGSPSAVFSAASPEFAEQKRDFGASRRRRWFGQ